MSEKTNWTLKHFFSAALILMVCHHSLAQNTNDLSKGFQVDTTSVSKVFSTTPPQLSTTFSDSVEAVNRYFIYTFDGRVMAGRKIEYKKPILNENYFMVDDKKIAQEIVKFYKTESGFYGSITNLKGSRKPEFALRVRRGNLNLFEIEKTNMAPGFHSVGPHGAMVASAPVGYSTKTNYYNIGFGDLKKASYKNLSIDLKDNPKSLLYLNKYKANRGPITVMYIVGGAVSAIGAITLYNKTKDPDVTPEPNVTANVVAFLGGGVIIGIGGFASQFNDKNLVKAIDVYNGL